MQNLLGPLPKVQQAKRAMEKAEANSLQVRVELQADCLAGMWPTEARQSGNSLNQEMWTLHSKRHPPSGMIDCSDNRKVTLCPMHLPTAPRRNVRGGS